ncbi:hypothetical protein ACPUYX_01920 [Desulfosporosinus sp. SYSU MS00001]|uniref:hypothetical protein n=1 Tax=Desulfosporosinus sp. SYSU MS00001 TaxID=3416284 RepID=UPI003CF68C61
MITHQTQAKEELFQKLDNIHKLFICNEDSLALKELDPVLKRMESKAEGMNPDEQETLQQLLLQSLKCLKDEDYVRLTDILIYEIKPMLKD